MDQVIHPQVTPLAGRVRVPGDKSLSHRAVLFAALAEGTSHLAGVLDSADVRSTIAAVTALGAATRVTPAAGGSLSVTVAGWGARGPVPPSFPIDCGNSGTTARLLLGVLAGWPGPFTLTGDESLSRRPMGRVTVPLATMGAAFTPADGTLPITASGGPLHPIAYDSPVASAQVKTALLLAGLRAEGRTLVREPALSRDHTERLLPAFGVAVGRDEATRACWVDGPATLVAYDVTVPGDPSSAAFIAVGALLVEGSEVVIEGVALNPTRVGFLAVLERMGAQVTVTPAAAEGSEPVGDLTVRHTPGLIATTVPAEEVPSLIDEVPVLALLAARAEGTTRFEGVGELRVKESDRLAAIVEGLAALGVTARATGDVLEVDGAAEFGAATLSSLDDHRLAMTWALAGLGGAAPVTIERFEAVEVSYPRFLDDLRALGAAPGGATVL